MNSFNDLKHCLTDQDINELVALLCFRCRIKTYTRVRSILTYSPSLIPSAGIFNRLTKENGKWEYTAGQSYPDEIRLVRELVLNG